MTSRYWVENFGCQMNLAESNALERQLEESGWQKSPSEDLAHAVILNSCSVRLSAEQKLWSRLSYFQTMKQRREFRLLVTGCMAERLQQLIQQQCPAVDHVVGSMAKDKIAQLLATDSANAPALMMEGQYNFFSDHSGSDNAVQGFVPIMHGCDNFCTYCIIPYVRGPEISRPAPQIIAEIIKQQQKGCRDVTLVGQNVNSYRWQQTNFNQLLLEVVAKTTIERIRFITPHPTDFDESFIEVIASSPRICNHVHLPIQHASDRILAEMNRGYTLDWYRSLVLKLRRALPELTITSDIMVGFPSETEDDLQILLDYVAEVQYDEAFTYYYNPIPGTPAAERDDLIPEELQKERLARLIALQHQITLTKMAQRVGRVERLLVERTSRDRSDELLGRTEYNYPVIFPGTADLIGKFCTVKTEELRGKTLWGKQFL